MVSNIGFFFFLPLTRFCSHDALGIAPGRDAAKAEPEFPCPAAGGGERGSAGTAGGGRGYQGQLHSPESGLATAGEIKVHWAVGDKLIGIRISKGSVLLEERSDGGRGSAAGLWAAGLHQHRHILSVVQQCRRACC